MCAECRELEQLRGSYFDAQEHIPPFFTKIAVEDTVAAIKGALRNRIAVFPKRRRPGRVCAPARRVMPFSGLLPMMEREYLRAVEARDNVCAGRPPRPWFLSFRPSAESGVEAVRWGLAGAATAALRRDRNPL
jgi:hypothetical protein